MHGAGLAHVPLDNEADKLLGSLQVDTSKVQAKLGWRTPVSLAEGMARIG